MNIKVITEEMPSHLTGGEYAVCDLNIYIDPHLDPTLKRELTIHAIVENYLPMILHEKVEELTELIVNGLEQISDL